MIINYKGMQWKELIDTIRNCQEELDSRGTVTKCQLVFWTNKQNQKTVFIKDEI